MSELKTYKFMAADGVMYIPKYFRDAVGMVGNTVFEVSVSGDIIMLKRTDKKNTDADKNITDEVIAEVKNKRAEIYSKSQIENYEKRKKIIKCSMCGCLHDLVEYKNKTYCTCCIQRVMKKNRR